MTSCHIQLYVGNLSTEGDEKSITSLFGQYAVTQVLMKNGYAFVELDNPVSADKAIRELNGEEVTYCCLVIEVLCTFMQCLSFSIL